jgi:hypothetical protein
MVFTPRRLKWSLPLVTLLLTALTACSSGVAPKADAAGGSPQAVTLGVTTVHLPANAAPAGAKLTLAAASNPLPSEARAVLKSLTTPVQVSLSGAQPLQPAMVRARLNTSPADPSKVYLVTQSTSTSPVQLVPATWDAGTHTISAPMSHFSVAFFGSIDVGSILNQLKTVFTSTLNLSIPRPDCSGKPVTRNGTTYTLPLIYTDKGDGVLWPCLHVVGDKISVELQSDTGLPYRVRVSPKADVTYGGTLDIGSATVLAGYQRFVTNAPYSESLLIPNSKVTYKFNPAELPGTIQAKVDVGSHLALSIVWAIQYVLTIAHIDVKLLDQADVLKCVGDAVDTAGLSGTQPSAAAMGSLMKSTISCAGPVVKAAGGVLGGVAAAVLSVLGGGAGLVIASLQGAIRTASGTDLTTLKIATATAATPAAYLTILNPRYGFSCDVPADFIATQAPANGDGFGYKSPNGQAEIICYGENNLGFMKGSSVGSTSAQDAYQQQLESIHSSGCSITYQALVGNSITVSGFSKSGEIYYTRILWGPGSTNGMTWGYPRYQQSQLQAAVEHSAAAFRPGDLASGH